MPLSAMDISPPAFTWPRSECSTSGMTPQPKRSARMKFSSRKKLSFQESVAAPQMWSNLAIEALLYFLLLHRPPEVVWFKKGASKEVCKGKKQRRIPHDRYARFFSFSIIYLCALILIYCSGSYFDFCKIQV